ncbi:probable RNA-binding protein 19 [Sitophilus oryzae]|uniref:Probable RNA-binding protein 19 n=1 Tax=Sitophilus oryzae TaxID=7048 RepID=A0A6J2X1X7_SITOR|nr:probable RNA-binding protein 19 [Sitophilus oryzae]
MSRLIIKNLPKSISEDKIRELFTEYGTITDIQLKYTPEGKFRKFAFIGFQNENQAAEAIEHLHHTFIATSKISVEQCALLGDSNKPKAWSKYAPDSTAYKKTHKAEIKDEEVKEKTVKPKKDIEAELLEKYKDDPMFEEFLQIHGDQDKLTKLKQKPLKVDSDDSGAHSDVDQSDENDRGSDLEEAPKEKLAEKPISDMEYMKSLMKGSKVEDSSDETVEKKPRQKMEKKIKEKVTLFTLKLKDLPYKIKKKDIREFFRPNVPFSIRIPRQIHGIAFVGFKTEKAFKKALLKDKSFIKGKQILVTKYEVKNSNDLNMDPKKSKWKNQEEALKNEEDIAESGKIFIRNLAYTTTEKEIEDLFSKYGPLTEINLPVDNTTRKMKGFGVVTFMMPEHAVKAYSELDGSILQGRMVHLLPGKAKDKTDDNLDDASNFKKKKQAKQKSQAGSSHNWNSLFLGQDAVAEVIADTYGTSKEAIVGPDSKGSAAVRLALGETQIVAQTRKYLEQQGVLLDVFNSEPKSRSKTLILVKNLPSKTEAREIRDIFQKHGEIDRVILPPSGITAIVEFLEPSEARKAYTRLAYSKFKNVPLYLEWAPENTLSANKSGTVENDVRATKDHEVTELKENEAVMEETEEVDEEPEPEATIFVKNLNFKTTDENLKKHFDGCGKIKYATVATKKDKNNPGSLLSMGYGFVQFYLKKSADKALKTLQQSVLDGKSLELKRSERTLQNEVTTTKKVSKKSTKQTGSKILVKNVPFQANRKEIWELFSTFGEIKDLRLPKKMSAGADSHRGFAFVDYVIPTNAKEAFEALSQSTHLYGRRLVLEWAKSEEGVEELRKRTADHFGSNEVVKSKKSVFNID